MKPILRLERQIFTPYCTIGTLYEDSKEICKTLENPWYNNVSNISCIPGGRYEVERDTKGIHQYFAIKNVPARTNIEIHIGNLAKDTKGCILCGSKLAIFAKESQLGIVQSKNTMEMLKDKYPEGFVLDITMNRTF